MQASLSFLFFSFKSAPVRKSERIRKRLIDINPEDIGENDNAKDKDYKL